MTPKPDRDLDIRTRVVTAGRPTGPGEPLNTPLVPASTFVAGGESTYARDGGTPTWVALEELIGGLEGGRAVAFASGMAATQAVFDQLPVGATVALPDDCYQGVAMLAQRGANQGRWTLRRIATADTETWLGAVDEVDLIWIESPSNPMLEIADVERICGHPRSQTIVAVDNTFATPLNQRPLELGADISVQSATKLIGGHSDLMAGLAATTSTRWFEQLVRHRTLTGGTPGALEAYLAVRGARTLAVRMQQSQSNAGVLAHRLSEHPQIEAVRYPGLADHPGHAIAARQLGGFGSIVSFEVRGGEGPADKLCHAVALIRHATSLGSVESTLERRASLGGQEHLPPGLIRLSVGIEDVDDLWHDLDRALNG